MLLLGWFWGSKWPNDQLLLISYLSGKTYFGRESGWLMQYPLSKKHQSLDWWGNMCSLNHVHQWRHAREVLAKTNICSWYCNVAMVSCWWFDQMDMWVWPWCRDIITWYIVSSTGDCHLCHTCHVSLGVGCPHCLMSMSSLLIKYSGPDFVPTHIEVSASSCV